MISVKSNINYPTYGDEMRKIRELSEQFSSGAYTPLTTSGNISWTSNTSFITYDTSTSSDPQILNKGSQGLLTWLYSLFLLDTGSGGYGDCLIDASYLSSIITAITNSELTYAEDGGSSDAYAISLEIAPTIYVSGQKFTFKAHTLNTGACTLNVNGLGAKPIVDFNNNALRTGAILAGQIVTVCYDGTSFRMLSDGGLLYNRIIDTPTIYNWDGWESANETWTYASATTFTISGNLTSKYQKYDKIKFTQTTTKYFYITNVVYSSPNTIITVSGGTDYSITNATISNNYYSKSDNPQGFPQSFNYTPSGISASNVTLSGRFLIMSGKRCYVDIKIAFTGGITFTTMPSLPIAVSSSYLSSGELPMSVSGNGAYLDAGVNWFPNGVYPTLIASATVVNIRGGTNGNAMSATYPITWANGDIIELHFNYEIN